MGSSVIKNKWHRLSVGRKLLLGAGVLLLLWWWFALPNPLFTRPLAVLIEDEQGELLGARIAADGQWRFPATDSLPDHFTEALLHFEDRRFYRHWGVDLRALVRAFRQNWQAGHIVSGGSTISMQVIRMARNNPRRTIWEKGLEILLALRLELRYSKAEILQFWAAQAPFGGNVVGLEAASWRYFGKAPTLLSWAEAATLAVLPNSPALIHPGRNRNALEAKRNRLLTGLLESQTIDSLTYELALAEPLPQHPLPLPRLAPQLLARIAAQNGPGRWQVSIQADLQQQVIAVAEEYQGRLAHNGIHNLAILVLETHTGKTLAYLGNLNNLAAEHSPSVDLIQAPRSPGSLLKPALYGLAVEEGLILPKELLPDIPSVFGGFRPENFHHAYQGAVPADLALARSLNIPFVHLLQRYGVAPFHQALRDWGFQQLIYSPEHYGLSLILGGGEVSLWEISAWYASLGRQLLNASRWQGLYHKNNWRMPHYLARPAANADSLSRSGLHLGNGASWATINAMEQLQRPNSEGDWHSFPSSHRMAWKTGTSFGFRDAWSVGIDPQYTIGIWVGNADGEGRPGLVGVQAAAPLLFSIRRLLPNTPEWFSPPLMDLQERETCQQSGQLAGKYCADRVSIPTPLAIPRATTCEYHQQLFLEQTGQFQVHQSCLAAAETIHPHSWFQLPPLQAHYYQSSHPEYRPLPPWRSDCAPGNSTTNPMQWIYPRSAEQIAIPRTWDGERSAVIFHLTHQQASVRVHWHLDGQFLGTTAQTHTFELQPTPGEHAILAIDEAGNRLRRTFTVVE